MQLSLENSKEVTQNDGVKYRLGLVTEATKFVFHWGFIPTVLYLGFRQGPDPGTMPLTLMSLLWQ